MTWQTRTQLKALALSYTTHTDNKRQIFFWRFNVCINAGMHTHAPALSRPRTYIQRHISNLQRQNHRFAHESFECVLAFYSFNMKVFCTDKYCHVDLLLLPIISYYFFFLIPTEDVFFSAPRLIFLCVCKIHHSYTHPPTNQK